MIRVQKYQDLGRFQNAWLNAHYHFSFSGYHNPERMGHGALRVINDDIVRGGGGFQMHPHRDMEIITYVRKGAISHRDNLGNKGKTEAGNVQVMSAGTGIFHSEHNLENVDTNLYQIWIEPNEEGVKPRWEAREFPKKVGSGLSLLASGLPEHQKSGAIFMHAD
ncbi:MAG: pirin family protein, partial [Proteobacteria bacterium]|nr:pirin family protein [Pseudomonadota bacterium]